MKYNHFEIDEMLSNMIILYDTREQDTPALHKRLEGFGCPSERVKLDYGDYTCKAISPSGEEINLSNVSVVERKMSLDELCNCFTKGRKRFENEFKRAIADGAKVHLLIEEGNYEKMFNGSYRSRLNPDALIASYLAWSERYNIQLHFCHQETTPRLIYKIMYYSLKCHLEKLGGE